MPGPKRRGVSAVLAGSFQKAKGPASAGPFLFSDIHRITGSTEARSFRCGYRCALTPPYRRSQKPKATPCHWRRQSVCVRARASTWGGGAVRERRHPWGRRFSTGMVESVTHAALTREIPGSRPGPCAGGRGSFGDRPTVGRRALTPPMHVRVVLPEPDGVAEQQGARLQTAFSGVQVPPPSPFAIRGSSGVERQVEALRVGGAIPSLGTTPG